MDSTMTEVFYHLWVVQEKIMALGAIVSPVGAENGKPKLSAVLHSHVVNTTSNATIASR
jgi:hypothetical protein